MLARVADSLYWLARYIERAENSARILDVNLQVTLDSDHTGREAEARDWLPILATLEEQTLFSSLYPATNAESVCSFVTFAAENPNSIASSVARARENARTVREYISSEMWERINGLYLWINSPAARQLFVGSAIDFYRQVVDFSHQFQGTTNATLTHGEGWNFLQAGMYLERGDCTSRLLDLKYHILLPSEEQVGGNVDTIQWQAVLKSCSAFEAFRKIHTDQITPWNVAEFILLHDQFPRSVRFCCESLYRSLQRISGSEHPRHYGTEAERLAGRLCADLCYVTMEEVFRNGLHEYLEGIQGRLIEVGTAMHREYCSWLDLAPA